MKQPEFYNQLAQYYDSIFLSLINHKDEYRRILRIISRLKKSAGLKLLDVGCGTGEYLKYLSKKFSCTGIDLSPHMLSIAKRKVKGAEFIRGDIENFKLDRKFDVIISFQVLAGMKNYKSLRKALCNLSQHLKKGGVFILDPYFIQANLKSGSLYFSTHSNKDFKIARAAIYHKKDEIVTINMHYLIAERGKKEVRHVVSRHKFRLFPVKKILDLLHKEGIKVKVLCNGLRKEQKLFIGVKNI